MKHTIHSAPARGHHHPSWLLILSCALGCWCLAGCKALTSTRLGTHRFDGRPVEGMAYSLPAGRVEIEVVKVTTSTAAAEDAAPAAPAPKTPAPAAPAPAPGAAPAPAPAPVPAPAPAPAAPGVAGGLPAIPDKDGKKPGDTPPITGAPSAPEAKKGAVISTSYRIRYKGTTYVPDRSKSFAVRYKGNGMSDDTIHVKVGKNGLLDLIEVTTVDKTVDITKKLLEIGKNVVRIATFAQAGGTTVTEEVVFTGSFDPTDPSDVAGINRDLKTVDGHSCNVEVGGRTSSRSGKSVYPSYVSPSGQVSTITPGQAYDGVVFRPAAPYTLTLSCDGKAQQRTTVLLPDKSEMLYMPINRSAFITKVQKLDFDDGMLVDSSLTKPSEVLGGVEIPLEITRAILALPGEIIGDNVAAMKGKQGSDAQALQTLQSQRALSRATVDEDTKDAQSILQQRNALKQLEQ